MPIYNRHQPTTNKTTTTDHVSTTIPTTSTMSDRFISPESYSRKLSSSSSSSNNRISISPKKEKHDNSNSNNEKNENNNNNNNNHKTSDISTSITLINGNYAADVALQVCETGLKDLIKAVNVRIHEAMTKSVTNIEVVIPVPFNSMIANQLNALLLSASYKTEFKSWPNNPNKTQFNIIFPTPEKQLL